MVCFDQFKQPRKKLDCAVDIPYDLDILNTFGQIEEEILSRNLPTEWGQIELGLICYQKSLSVKSDHYNLKSSGAIMAFVSECRKKKNIQLRVYSTKQIKRKQICGSSVTDDDMGESIPKKNRVHILMIMYLFNIYNLHLFVFNKKKFLFSIRNQNLILLVRYWKLQS